MKYLILMSVISFYFSGLNAQTISNPDSLFDPTPYGFSHVVSVPPNKKLIFVAGQGGEENKEGKLSGDFRKQVRQSLKNIQTALKTQGIKMNAVVKVTTLVVDHNRQKLQIIVEEFEKMWPEKNFPVNTLIPVPKLALEQMQVEIDAIAISNQ